MTAEETAQFYKAREAYREKCDDFKQELDKYLSNYVKSHNRHHLPQLRA